MKSNIEFLYEELRKATDGGSESMTHDDALKQIAYWRDKCSQAQAVEPISPWQDRIQNKHPASDPEYWPDELIAKYARAEVDDLRREVGRLQSEAEQAQAVEPVATVQCVRGVTIGYLDVMQPVGTKLYTHPAPPVEQAQAVEPVGYLNLASVKLPGEKHPACEFSYERNNNAAAAIPLYIHPAPPPAGERAELIADLRLNHEYLPKEVILFAADMLEADVSLINEGKKAQQVAVPDGWALVPIEPTPAILDAMSSSGWKTACYKAMLAAAQGAKQVAQQVAVPMTEAQIFACDPVPHVMFDQQRIDFARAIEAFHGIGAKP